MNICASFGRKMEHLSNLSSTKIGRLHKSCKTLNNIRALIYQTNPFWIQFFYLLFLSFVGYLALKISTPRTPEKLNDFDIFFTSVSSATVSSMAALPMEVFSNIQLIIITILMLVGGEVFISLLGLLFSLHKQALSVPRMQKTRFPTQELGSFSGDQKPENDVENNTILSLGGDRESTLKFLATKSLSYVVLGYLLVVHLIGSSSIAIYASLVPSVMNILARKGIKIGTFSMFLVASTFANGGYVPTNENMIVFKKNSGLLLLLIPHTLLGSSLYASSLRLLIWVLGKITKRVEYSYLLKNDNNNNNNNNLRYSHLMSSVRCWSIAMTTCGFIAIQFMVFCFVEWKNSPLMDGLNNGYEKIVAVIFQVVNTRHSGEYVFDLSLISPAILVIFVVMMYLPPYTSYLPIMQEEDQVEKLESKNRRKPFVQCLLFSQLSYLVIFIILICAVEREKMKTDPLNFNVFNITLEVISAYGNVGLSMGYSCERRIKADMSCKEEWIGFVGKWSNLGKFVLILVMFFGKLKNFNKHGGQAWKMY